MSIREIVSTTGAPSAIGTYSQAVRVGQMVWLSGQIPLDPETMTLVGDNTPEGIAMQIHQAFRNLAVVAEAAGGSLNDAVKVNLYLTDLSHFGKVNEIMANYFVLPYPARAEIGRAHV